MRELLGLVWWLFGPLIVARAVVLGLRAVWESLPVVGPLVGIGVLARCETGRGPRPLTAGQGYSFPLPSHSRSHLHKSYNCYKRTVAMRSAARTLPLLPSTSLDGVDS